MDRRSVSIELYPIDVLRYSVYPIDLSLCATHIIIILNMDHSSTLDTFQLNTPTYSIIHNAHHQGFPSSILPTPSLNPQPMTDALNLPMIALPASSHTWPFLNAVDI